MMTYYFFVSVLFLVISVTNADNKCVKVFDEETICKNITLTPSTDLISPTHILTLVQSEGVLTQTTLSPLATVTEIIIRTSNISVIQSGTLCSMPHLVSINLIDNLKIPPIGEDTLANCNQLKKVSLNGRIQLEEGTFRHTPNLETLTLNDTTFPNNGFWNNNTFQGLKSLKTLTVSYSNVKSLNVGVFSDVTKLKYLDLKKNQISEVSFWGLENVEVLDLSGNQITNLNWDEIQNLKALKALFLDRNPLKTVLPEKLALLGNLERVFLVWQH